MTTNYSAPSIASSSTLYTSSTVANSQEPPKSSPTTFTFPTYTSFPPFYTLQPNLQTRTRQLELWSSLLNSYTRHTRTFRLNLSSPPPGLFSNASISRSLKPADIYTVLEFLSLSTNGGIMEWIPPATKGGRSDSCYVWWRSAGEWADLVYSWVEGTGQKGQVLTIYELREGEGMEWRDMDEGMLRKVLNVLVKRGKAQVFGQDGGGDGVKFF